MRRIIVDATAAGDAAPTAAPTGAVRPVPPSAPARHGASGRAPWPFAAPPGRPLPATLPSGRRWPKVSIVTPSLNQGAYIEETILSVLNQGYPNVEHIVIDGGSTDGTAAVLARYRDALAACRSEPDRGQSDAINKGFALATGEILTWLNSDDLLAPGALAGIALAFDRSGADVVAGICQLWRDGALVEQHLTSCEDGPLPLAQLLDVDGQWMRGRFFYQPEVFFSRAIWERAGGHVDEALHYSMDYELWLRFAIAGARLHVVGRPVARYRLHDAQKTVSTDRFRPELERVRRRHLPSAGSAKDGAAVTASRRVARLRIAAVNDVGFRFGAGIAHGRIARALAAAGHEVVPLAVWSENVPERQRARPYDERLVQRLREIAPDVVLLGNVHGAGLAPERLPEIAAAWPTVLVLHDEWLLTGRCAYPGPCDRNLGAGCDAECPTATEYPALTPALIRPAFDAKRRLAASTGAVVLAANSRWTKDEVSRAGAAWGAPVEAACRRPRLLHYGVPLDVFAPRDASACRDALGLPQDRFIVLFTSWTAADPRKGGRHLVEALRRARIPHLLPVVVGDPGDGIPGLEGAHFTGHVESDLTRALLFSAADVFAGPSLQEAFGQVFVEAAACGTPSVGYAVGGVPDALVDGVSGLLVQTVSPDALAGALELLYADPDLRRDLGTWGRLHVANAFSVERSAHHAMAAVRDALQRAGVELEPKLAFPAAAPALGTPEYLLAEYVGDSAGHLARVHSSNGNAAAPAGWVSPIAAHEKIETVVLRYFVERLAAFRRGRIPWYLRPGAWLAKLNRQVMRRAVKRAALPGARRGDGDGAP